MSAGFSGSSSSSLWKLVSVREDAVLEVLQDQTDTLSHSFQITLFHLSQGVAKSPSPILLTYPHATISMGCININMNT